MSRASSFTDVIGLWPTIVAFAADMQVEYDTARKWKDRNHVPSSYWFNLLRAARRRKIKIDAADLVIIARDTVRIAA